MSKAETEEAGSFSKSEQAKLQKLFRDRKAAYGSNENPQKTSGLSNTKITHFLCRKHYRTNFWQAFWHFKQLRAFAKVSMRVCVSIWHLWISFPNSLPVKYLLVSEDVFSCLVCVQPMKIKYTSDAVALFEKMLRKKINSDRLWVDQVTEFAGEFKKISESKDVNIYSTWSGTEAAAAETAIRSLKSIVYRYNG